MHTALWKKILVASIALGGEAALACSTRVQFDITEQSLDTALLKFAQQAKVPVLFPSGTYAEIQVNDLHGEFCVEDALDRLLEGSDVDASIDETGQIVFSTEEVAEDLVETGGKEMPVNKSNNTRNAIASTIAALFAGGLGNVETTYAQEQNGEQSLEEITVTGSRIQRDGMTTATPVTAVGGDELQNMAPTLLMDAINMLPQFRNNDQSHTSSIFGSAGQNSVNLRGVGGNRTLVLLDGRRVVSSTKDSTVDIALFPQPLVARMELVTGGASAAYGSDAISGVTNFILDTDFTGITSSIQGGITDRQDRANSQFQLAGGMPLGDRSHIIASVDYFTADDVRGYSGRDWFQSWGMLDNPDPNGPDRVICSPAYSLQSTLGGIITNGPLAGTQFQADGTPTETVMGDFVSPGNAYCGGLGEDPAREFDVLYPDEERYSMFLHWKYELTDNTEVYFQAMKGVHTIGSTGYTSAAGPWRFEIFQDNAYLPESIRQRMVEEDIESFTMGRTMPDIYTAYRTTTHDMRSFTTGFESLMSGFTFSGYYQYGETVQVANYAENNGQVRIDRIYRAADAVVDPDTGQVVCRQKLSGVTPEQEGSMSFIGPTGVEQFADPQSNALCTPLNIFGYGNASQQAIDYVADGNHHNQEVTQHFLEGTVQFDPFDTWAGTVSLVAGASYREDEVFQQAYANDPETRNIQAMATLDGADVGYKGIAPTVVSEEIYLFGNPNADSLPIQGGFDVTELFSEAYVPLYRGDNGSYIDMNLAARYADYSGSGEVWAGKVGLDWQVTNDVRLRGTYSRDTRAGSLSERYDQQGGGGTIDDPFNPELAPYVTSVFEGGNPNINPEVADTITYGIVYQPSWLEGLGMTLDFYDIKIADAISELSIQQLVDECFAGAEDLCSRIFFAPDGKIQDIFNFFVNVAEARTTGVDFELQYTRPVTLLGGNESLRFRGFVNYLTEVSEQNVGAAKQDRAGNRDIPELVATANITYSRDNFQLYLQQRYTGSTVRDVRWESGVDISNNEVSSITYTDLNLSWDMDVTGGGNYRLYANINNLFDKEPVLTPGGPGRTGNTSHTIGQFDILGRRYVLGMEYNF